MTPLHFAAKQDEVRTMKCLADNGADIDIKDVNGVSMLSGLPIEWTLVSTSVFW